MTATIVIVSLLVAGLVGGGVYFATRPATPPAGGGYRPASAVNHGNTIGGSGSGGGVNYAALSNFLGGLNGSGVGGGGNGGQGVGGGGVGSSSTQY